MKQNNKGFKIKDLLEKIKQSPDPMGEIDNIQNANLASLLRRQYLTETLGISLSATGSTILDFHELEGKSSYKPIGSIQMPVTVIGPINMNGEGVKGKKYLPLASINPPLLKTIELGHQLHGTGPVTIQRERCWIKLFVKHTDNNGCLKLRRKIGETITPLRQPRILCYGTLSGYPVESIIIEDEDCGSIEKTAEYIDEIQDPPIIREPLLSPYLIVEQSTTATLKPANMRKIGVDNEKYIDTYRFLEELRPISAAVNSLILASIAAHYNALNIRMIYGLRSRVRKHYLKLKLGKITLNMVANIVLPLVIRGEEQTLMGRELSRLVTEEEITPLKVGETTAVIALLAFSGSIGGISSSL